MKPPVKGLDSAEALFVGIHSAEETVPESDLTPFMCRAGCKHYDGVKNVGDGSLKEFCWYGRSHLIEGARPCDHFEDGNPVYDDKTVF